MAPRIATLLGALLLFATPTSAQEPEPAAQVEQTSARRPRVRVAFVARGPVLAPMLAELSGLGLDVEPVASLAMPSDPTELDALVRIREAGPEHFAVEVWFVAEAPEQVASIESSGDTPATIALRTAELLHAVLVGARAFEARSRAPSPAPPPPPVEEPTPPPPPPSAPTARPTVGLALGGALSGSPRGGLVPGAALALSLHLVAPLELALSSAIPLTDARDRVSEGRVDVRVAPVELSLRYAPRFGRFGIALGVGGGLVVTRVVGRATREALLGREQRTLGALLGALVGAHVSLGASLELLTELRVGVLLPPVEVRVADRVVSTWSTWLSGTVALRVRLGT